MASVAQLVRASDCGSEGRGFESRHSPFDIFGVAQPQFSLNGFRGNWDSPNFILMLILFIKVSWGSCLELLIVVQKAAGSNPVTHPIYL